ncbi:MAG: hypothetical protein HY286_18770 [Planctomycetes bacterium]|nr:hypothetical protein [Planctomycetota bacterium]
MFRTTVRVAAMMIAAAIVPFHNDHSLQAQPKRSALDAFALLNADAFEPHPYFVYTIRSGYNLPLPGGSTATINALGGRGRALTPKHAPRTRRILFIGGSNVFGLMVADGETLASQVEARFAAAESKPTESRPAWEIGSFAVPGYTSHEVASAFSLKWIDYEPDAIVVGDLDADAFAYLTEGYRNDYGHLWKMWIDEGDEMKSKRSAVNAAKQAHPLALAEFVLAAVPGDEASRKRALEQSNTQSFETNIKFLADVAAGRKIRTLFILPDSRHRSDGIEIRAVKRIREAAARIFISKNIRLVDSENVPERNLSSSASRNEFLSGMVADQLTRMNW